MGGRLGQVEPGLDGIIGRAMDRDLVMRAKRRHALARPAVAVACGQLVSVQQSGDEIVVGDQHEVPDGGNDVGRGAAALAASTSRLDASGVTDLGSSGMTTHVNKVHHVTTITQVARDLGEDEDWLWDIAPMKRKSRTVSSGEDGITDSGIQSVIELIK